MTQKMEKSSIDRAVSRYSYLFTLPSHKKISELLVLQCAITGTATYLSLDASLVGFLAGLTLGLVLSVLTFLGNYVMAHVLLTEDLILDLRRCSFLSVASNMILLPFGFVASLATVSLGDLNFWFKVMSFGTYASLCLRVLVLVSLSFMSMWRIVLSAVLQPALVLAALLVPFISLLKIQSTVPTCLFLAVFLAFLGVYLFVVSVNNVGTRTLGIPSLTMFKAFLANWTEALVEPFEEILERLSEEGDILVSAIAFRARGRLKAAIVVPSLHPGPFKNIGSSAIPHLIQEVLEKRLGCVVAVPHGISGHELDLASQAENQKVLNRIVEATKFVQFHPLATPFVSVKEENATVGCQVFGDFALLTLTLAPETMEDLPLQLNGAIVEEAKSRGLSSAAAIDAHNSLQGAFDAEGALVPLKKAAASALEKALGQKQLQFEVGVARVISSDLRVEDGMGSGGISAIVTRVGELDSVYVTIDGNNMVSGLREKVLSGLQELGLEDGEVLTTDTHEVNAVVMADRGYHPIGERIGHDKLTEYTNTAAAEALRNMEPAEACWHQEIIQEVKVIGESQINSLCQTVDEGARRAKKSSRVIFPTLGILLAVLFIFV